MSDDFRQRYPHGVLTEQEGGVPNDAVNWDDAKHVCRKHKVPEWICADAKAVCTWCGQDYPAMETTWLVAGKFYCGERCARLAVGLRV